MLGSIISLYPHTPSNEHGFLNVLGLYGGRRPHKTSTHSDFDARIEDFGLWSPEPGCRLVRAPLDCELKVRKSLALFLLNRTWIDVEPNV